MSLRQHISAHLLRPVQRKAAMFLFVGSVGLLLTVLVIGAGMLVALVFAYGFGTDKFFYHVSHDTIELLKLSAIALAATGVLSFATVILGSCLLVASISHAHYRKAYIGFAITTVILAALSALFFG